MRRAIEVVLAAVLALAPLAVCAEGGSEADRLAELLGVKLGSRVAEIGAGEGDLAFEMAERVGAGGLVYATELEGDDLRGLHARAKLEAVTNLRVVTAQRLATGLPDRCCDAVFMRNVYHHFSDPIAIAKDIQRALAPGGRLVIIDFPPTWFLAAFSPDGVGEERTGHGITIEAALRELREAGLVHVETIETWTFRWWLGPDVYALVLREGAR